MRLTDFIIEEKSYKDIVPYNLGEQKCAPSHSFGPAVREYYLLHFVVSGKGKFITPRGEYLLGEGDMFVIRPYEVTYYEADGTDPWHYIWVGFTTEREMPLPLRSMDVISDPSLGREFCRVRDNSGWNERHGVTELALSLVYGIMATLLGDGQSCLRAEGYVRAAIRIMESEFSTGITVSEIADRLHVNRQHLQTLFKEVARSTPGDYLKSVRMSRAAQLLRRGDYTVSVVAASVGYSDAFVFSRAFKEHFGISPSQYKKGI